MEGIEDNSLESLSALCSLEHFGLGRYGDPIDPEACFKAFKSIQRVMKSGGRAYISVPVGKSDKLAFNAHRIFRPETIDAESDQMELADLQVTRGGKLYENGFDHIRDSEDSIYAFGLFELVKR